MYYRHAVLRPLLVSEFLLSVGSAESRSRRSCRRCRPAPRCE